MTNELDNSTGVTNPLVLIDRAIEKGISPDDLGKLLDLQERWERNRAAEEYSSAMAKFQAECPVILKRRTAKVKDWTFDYASFDDVMREAGPVLAQCGLAVSFTSDAAEHGIKITCRIRKGIHFEDKTLTLPIPAGVVTDTQRYGMALSYAKRYCLCAALNIVVTDEDNDASTCLDFISDAESKELLDLIEKKGVDFDRFLAWGQLESLETMPKSLFPKAISLLRQKKAK